MRADILKRYLKGDCSITVKGGFPDLFLRICAEEKAALRNVFVQGGRVTVQVNRRYREAVSRAARRSGMEIENETLFGLYYTFERYRTRVGIPVGLVLAVLILKLLSSMLWSVEVQGLSTVNEEDFMRFLTEENVKKGTYLMRLDCNEIEEKIERYNASVLRATVNLVGCRMYIEVHERELPPEIDDTDRYCNVIAAKGGEVIKADILAGAGSVKPGDLLNKGDLIAAGVIELKNGSVRYLEAKANVIAKTENEYSASVIRTLSVRKTEKIRDRFSLYFFGFVFPPCEPEHANIIWLSTRDTVFPAGIVRQRVTKLTKPYTVLTQEQCRLLAMDRVAVAAANGLGGKTVRSCTVSFHNENMFRIAARFICEENIARQQYFEVVN